MIREKLILKKFEQKGGWTYAEISGISQDSSNPFGWVTVSGSIDGYLLEKIKLMPMGDRKLFLPVKASIRKRIKKEAGDIVDVRLWRDDAPLEMDNEIRECFETISLDLVTKFNCLSASERHKFLKSVYEASDIEKKTKLINQMIDELLRT